MTAFISSHVFNFTKYISFYLVILTHIVPTYKTKTTKVLFLPLSTSWIQLSWELPYSE